MVRVRIACNAKTGVCKRKRQIWGQLYVDAVFQASSALPLLLFVAEQQLSRQTWSMKKSHIASM